MLSYRRIETDLGRFCVKNDASMRDAIEKMVPIAEELFRFK